MNKTLLVTGGTGSFGNSVVKKFLKSKNFSEIRIFSRDESKQDRMSKDYNNSKLSFFLGDIRDEERMFKVCRGVDVIFHAAALKQVPSCEKTTWETIKTNIIGSRNVIEAAISNKVKNLTMLSTDKSVYPINTMGMTKALMEKLALSVDFPGKTNINCVRYGNVLYTRGSVIPLFVNQIFQKKDLTITEPNMTRFLMKIEDSLDLAVKTTQLKSSGNILVKKSPAAKIINVANVLLKIFNSKSKIKIVGLRPGEKKYETLITREEMIKTKSFSGYYVINDKHIKNKTNKTYPEYDSNSTKQLNNEELKKLILSLPEIQQALNH
jgi:UDP-N-acetylglucosamine 4,6-dehydratase/5-epimerase